MSEILGWRYDFSLGHYRLALPELSAVHAPASKVSARYILGNLQNDIELADLADGAGVNGACRITDLDAACNEMLNSNSGRLLSAVVEVLGLCYLGRFSEQYRLRI